jgi:hypothetical protein
VVPRWFYHFLLLLLSIFIFPSVYTTVSLLFDASLKTVVLEDSSLPRNVEEATPVQVDPAYSMQNENEGIFGNEIAPKRNTTIPSHLPYGKFSSVDSFTCRGLGHRMTRIANAAHLENYLGLALRKFWDSCQDIHVFHYLLIDMFVLSHEDVVVAARPSSFVQSLPMSLVFDKLKKSRSVIRIYCETKHIGSELRCFENYIDWCCNGIRPFALYDLNQQHEYVKLPFGVAKRNYTLAKRKPNCMFKNIEGSAQRTCIPFSWPTSYSKTGLLSTFEMAVDIWKMI